MDAFQIISFHGGMNRKVNPLLLKAEEARIAKNVDIDEIGSLKKCKGYSAYGNVPNSNEVKSLYSFYKITSSGTERYFLRESGGYLYKYDPSTSQWTSIASELTSGAVWETYLNTAVRFNGVDNPKKFDGSSFSDLGGSPPNGSIVRLYKNRLYVAGVSPNFSTVYYSKVGLIDNWPAFNNFDVNANDGDKIMWMEPVFDSLLIFKENSIWEFKVDRLNNPSTLRYITLDIGTTSGKSVVNINGIVYFFNRKGVFQFASRYPELISLKVDDFIQAVQDPYNVKAFGWGNKYCLFLGNITVEGKTYSNCLLVYDTIADQWTVRTLAHPISSATTFIGSDNQKRVYFGSTNGQVYLWDDGYTFGGTPIELEYETGIYQPGNPKNRKKFRMAFLRVEDKSKSPPILHYSIDGRDFVQLDILDKNIKRPKFHFEESEGTDIKFRIHEVSNKEMRAVYQIIIYYDDLEAETEKKAGYK
jgi:hypothetical protein